MRRVPRLYKVLAAVFLAYAVLTAAPEHQSRIADGALALKDAAVSACVRDDGICTRAFAFLSDAAGSVLSDGPAPWMDEGQRPQTGSAVRVEPPQERASPVPGAGRS